MKEQEEVKGFAALLVVVLVVFLTCLVLQSLEV